MFNSSFVNVCTVKSSANVRAFAAPQESFRIPLVCSSDTSPTLLGCIPFASDKLNSCIRPTEPDVSAWPSREATCSESTNSSFRSGSSSGLKQMVKNTLRLPTGPAGWTETVPWSKWKIQRAWWQAFTSDITPLRGRIFYRVIRIRRLQGN